MAFVKKTWLQRIVSSPGRRRLSDTGTTNVYDVSRAEGEVIQEGDAWSAANMNDFENRIEAGFDEALTAANIANNLTTNVTGFALDARMGKKLGDDVTAIKDTLNGFKFYGGSVPLVFQSTTQLGNSDIINLTELNINEVISVTVSINYYDDISEAVQKTDRIFASRQQLNINKLLHIYANSNDASYVQGDSIWAAYSIIYK